MARRDSELQTESESCPSVSGQDLDYDFDAGAHNFDCLEENAPEVMEEEEFSHYMGNLCPDDVFQQPVNELDKNRFREEVRAQFLGVLCSSGKFFQDMQSAAEIENAFNSLSSNHGEGHKSTLDALMEKYLENDPNLLSSCMRDKTNFFKLELFENIMEFDELLGKFRPLARSQNLQNLKFNAENARRGKLLKSVQKSQMKQAELENPEILKKRINACNLLMELISVTCNERQEEKVHYQWVQDAYNKMSQPSSNVHAIYKKYKSKLNLEAIPSLEKESCKVLFGASKANKWLKDEIISAKVGHEMSADNFIYLFLITNEKYCEEEDIRGFNAKFEKIKEEQIKEIQRLQETFNEVSFWMPDNGRRKQENLKDTNKKNYKPITLVTANQPETSRARQEPSVGLVEDREHSLSVSSSVKMYQGREGPIIHAESEIGEHNDLDKIVPPETPNQKLTRMDEFARSSAKFEGEEDEEEEPIYSKKDKQDPIRQNIKASTSLLPRPQTANEPNPLQEKMQEKEKEYYRRKRDEKRLEEDREKEERKRNEEAERTRMEQQKRQEEERMKEEERKKMEEKPKNHYPNWSRANLNAGNVSQHSGRSEDPENPFPMQNQTNYYQENPKPQFYGQESNMNRYDMPDPSNVWNQPRPLPNAPHNLCPSNIQERQNPSVFSEAHSSHSSNQIGRRDDFQLNIELQREKDKEVLELCQFKNSAKCLDKKDTFLTFFCHIMHSYSINDETDSWKMWDVIKSSFSPRFHYPEDIFNKKEWWIPVSMSIPVKFKKSPKGALLCKFCPPDER